MHRNLLGRRWITGCKRCLCSHPVSCYSQGFFCNHSNKLSQTLTKLPKLIFRLNDSVTPVCRILLFDRLAGDIYFSSCLTLPALRQCVCTQTPPQLFSPAYEPCPAARQQDMCVYMWIICVGHVKPSTALSSGRLAEVHLGISRVSLAQFLLNLCFFSSCQNFAVSHEETTREAMSDRGIFKAEKVFIKDSVDGGEGNTGMKLQVSTTRALSSSCKLWQSVDILQYRHVCMSVCAVQCAANLYRVNMFSSSWHIQ